MVKAQGYGGGKNSFSKRSLKRFNTRYRGVSDRDCWKGEIIERIWENEKGKYNEPI